MTMRIKPLVWEKNGKFSLLGRGFWGYTTSISFSEDGRFKINLRGIGVLRPTLAMAKELLEEEYQEFMAPAFETTPTTQLSAALQVPEVQALVDAVNVTTIIAHALADGYIDEKVEDQFRSALDEINAALVPIYAALAPFGKATE